MYLNAVCGGGGGAWRRLLSRRSPPLAARLSSAAPTGGAVGLGITTGVQLEFAGSVSNNPLIVRGAGTCPRLPTEIESRMHAKRRKTPLKWVDRADLESHRHGSWRHPHSRMDRLDHRRVGGSEENVRHKLDIQRS